MKIASLKEDLNLEKRISITPEIAKKFISLGFEVLLENSYGTLLGFEDEEYKNLGVKFSPDSKTVIEDSDIILQVGLPSADKLNIQSKNKILIGSLNPYKNSEILNKFKDKFNFFFFRTLTKNYKSSIHGYTFVASKFSRI